MLRSKPLSYSHLTAARAELCETFDLLLVSTDSCCLNNLTNSLDVGESVAFWEVVRVSFPEHVTNAAAGENLQAAAAHPHPEGQLCRRTHKRQRGM